MAGSGTGGARAVLAADLDLLRPLHAAGVSTIMLLRKRQRFLRHSRIVRDWVDFPDPATEQEKALAALIDVARGEAERPVLYYADDAMLALVRRYRSQLEPHYRFLMPASDLVIACGDKIGFNALARAAGVPVPRTATGADVASADDVAAFGFPLVIKPGSHVGWFASEAVALAGGKSRKIIVANDRQEFETLLAATRRFTDNFIVQEFIPGGEDQVYSFHAFVREDLTPAASFVGRKIRTYPALGGESSYIALVRDFSIHRLGKDVVQKLGVSGPVKIDFKRDPRTGRDYVLEINLRFNLWHQLGAVCGVNLLLIAYRISDGRAVAADRRLSDRHPLARHLRRFSRVPVGLPAGKALFVEDLSRLAEGAESLSPVRVEGSAAARACRDEFSKRDGETTVREIILARRRRRARKD